MEKKSFLGLDIFKFTMAVIVVAIHTRPFINLNSSMYLQIWTTIAHLAVPYFFMASGYLLFFRFDIRSDRKEVSDRVKKYLQKIFKLYIIWSLIYIPITIFHFSTNNKEILVDSIFFIRGLFLIGEQYYSYPLWYLLSMIYSLILIYFLILKGKSYNYNRIWILILLHKFLLSLKK